MQSDPKWWCDGCNKYQQILIKEYNDINMPDIECASCHIILAIFSDGGKKILNNESSTLQ